MRFRCWKLTYASLVPDTEISRRRIFRQIRNVVVFQATQVEQAWTVEYNGQTVSGQPEPGHVALNSTDEALQLFFAQSSIDTGRSKRELVDRLYNFCGMSKSTSERTDYQWLLSQILDEDNMNEIEDILDRALVPELPTDEELEEEEERNNMERLRPPPRRWDRAAGRDWAAVDEAIERLLRDGVCVITTASGTIRMIRIGNRAGANGSTGIPQALLDELATEAWADVGSIVGEEDIGDSMYSFPAIPVVDHYAMFNAERLVMSLLSIYLDTLLISYQVHNRLKTLEPLGSGYVANEHWTSKHRATLGFSSYTETNPPAAAFCFPDTDHLFSYTLMHFGHPEVQEWTANELRYHVEVMTTSGGRASQFLLTNAQLDRVCITLKAPHTGTIADTI